MKAAGRVPSPGGVEEAMGGVTPDAWGFIAWIHVREKPGLAGLSLQGLRGKRAPDTSPPCLQYSEIPERPWGQYCLC